LGGLYLHSTFDLVSPNLIRTVLADSLESSAGGSFKINYSKKISDDILFLTTLASLRKIEVDLDFFNDKYFKSLKDNKIRLNPVTPGRNNPFSPMGSDNAAIFINLRNIITNQATDISTNSANLNGTLNTISGVSDIYFNYGINQQDLDNKITVANQSLVGTFVKKIENLSSATLYFYKACAKINNIDVCGEIVSFTTN
jgi:hypothetical protein